MQRYRPDIAWPLNGDPFPIMAEDSATGEYYHWADVDMELTRLRNRCWALAFIAYPYGAPREAVPEDFGLHPTCNEAKSRDV